MRKITVELSKKSVKDLENELRIVHEEVRKLQIEYRVKPQKDTNLIKKKRTYIAQVATVLGAKRLVEANKPEVKEVKTKK